MKKNVAICCLTAAVGAAILTGCSGSGEAANNGTASAVADESGEVDGIMYPTGLPIVDDGACSFSIFCDDASETGKFYMMDQFKKQTNVDVELRLFPNATATERLNLDLNSGDYADVIGGWVLNDSMILSYGVNQGVFIPLEDYYAKYCPKIREILDLPGVREQMTAPDGHIYSIPYVCADSQVGYSPYINGKWLDDLGLSMPATTDEFEAVLKAFKEKDPSGTGNVIPFSADPQNKHIEAMAGWFGLPMNKYGVGIQDGEVVYGGASGIYRKFLGWFNSLYAQGMIDSELYTQDRSTWTGKGNQHLFGVCIAFGSGEYSGDKTTEVKTDYSVLPVLNTDNGGIWLRDTNGFSVYRTQAVVTDNAGHPEVICRWFDNAFGLENGIGCSRGPVGTVVFKKDDGYHAIDTSTLPDEEQDALGWSNLWPQSLPKYLPSDFKFIEDKPLYDEKKTMEKTYEPSLTKETIPNKWIPLEDVDRYSDISTALNNYFVQQQAMFVTGEQDVNDDTQWENYVDGLYSLGLKDWLKMEGVDKVAD